MDNGLSLRERRFTGGVMQGDAPDRVRETNPPNLKKYSQASF
jgi:hypothetical protein